MVEIRSVSTAEETAEKALKSSSITPEGQVASIVKMINMMILMMTMMMMMMLMMTMMMMRMLMMATKE